MKIASTDLALYADRSALTRQQESESLRAWRGERPDFERMESAIANISQAGREFLARMSAALPMPTFAATETAPTATEASAIEAASDAADNDPFLSLVKQMVELLTGKEVRVFDMEAFSTEMRHVEARSSATTESLQAAGNGRAGYGVEYDYHAVREEFEQTRFSAEGVIRTTDGQEISFSLDLEMTRYYREESSVSLRAGDAVRKDPLVVNFGGTGAQLASAPNQRFRFDLDGDGRQELLPLFASGSGYLALDRNRNGIIDMAEELFGPSTDNGFAELARLDDDKNGWIDEGDAAFDKLLVWTPAAEGNGDLRSLADLGIGALGLHHLTTPFALRGSANEDLGQTRASGLYLKNDGKSGTLQEIDLTV